jgi:hypothetical protein
VKVDYSKYKIRSKVVAYSVGTRGLYILLNGTLFGSDLNGLDLKLLDLSPGKYVNVAYSRGQSSGTLILRDKSGARYLNYVDSYGNIKNLERDLQGKAFLNSYDQLIYANKAGEIYYYDDILKEKMLVVRLAG